MTKTENGALALKTSENSIVDLFYTIGASRGRNIIDLFEEAFKFSKEEAVRVALWARDVRGGAGERQLFRDILLFLEKNDFDIFQRVILKVPELGRWDDLLEVKTKLGFKLVAKMIKKQIDEDCKNVKPSLAAKKGESGH